MPYQHEQWKGNTGGTPWMQRTLVRWFRHTPLVIPYFCMGWMVPFYMFRNRSGCRASYRYFRNRLGRCPVRAFFDVYAQHFRFGQVIVDRFAMFAGQKFHLDYEGKELLDQLELGERGFMLLSSHVGNYELSGYSMRPRQKWLYALVFQGETETVMEQRKRMFEGNHVYMVPVSDDMSHVYTLSAKLAEGHIVSMPADRIFGSPRSIECNFLGAPACLPLGPFALAVLREVPVLALFVMKESVRRYRIIVRPINIDSSLARSQQMELMAQQFANEMSDILHRYPHQWFNFYEFWQ